MAVLSRSHYFRGIVAFLLMIASFMTGCFAVLVLIEGVAQDGSSEGRILLIGGVLLLVGLAAVFFVAALSSGGCDTLLKIIRTIKRDESDHQSEHQL